MKALSKRHPLNLHFVAQLELDIEASGIAISGIFNTPEVEPPHLLSTGFPNTPMNGLLAERAGAPMTIAEIQNFIQDEHVSQSWTSRIDPANKIFAGATYRPAASGSQSPPDTGTANAPHGGTFSRQPIDSRHTSYQASNDRSTHVVPPIPPMAQGENQFQDLSPLANSDSMPTNLSGNTPSSDSSSSNPKQFPYRPSEPDSRKTSSVPSRNPWPRGTNPLLTTDWTMTQDELDDFEHQQLIVDSNAYLDEAIWNHDPGHSWRAVAHVPYPELFDRSSQRQCYIARYYGW